MIPLIRRLWTAEEISHDGPFYSMTDVRVHPAPSQPGGPPIIVAGRREVAMRRAALLGNGWMPYLYSPRRYAKSVQRVREFADQAGRDLLGFGWYVFVFINVHPDGRTARQQTANTMGGTYNQDFQEMVDSVAAAGTAGEVGQKLQDFVDAGARHFIFLPATGGNDPEPVLHSLFEDVVPGLTL
jgi:alkanesulfonate monooxygenase SsuD/methylene tetrahydromethanopterin reductase-like flavin-dependent oxidoreductase (luciferase family)